MAGLKRSQQGMMERTTWSPWQRRSLIALATYGVLILLVYLTLPSDGLARVAVVDLLFVGFYGAIFIACLVAFRRGGPMRQTWAWFAAALFCWFVGTLIWTYYDLWLRVTAPYPSLADIGYLLFYPCVIAGALAIPRGWHRQRPSLEEVFDSLLIAVLGGFIVYQYLLGPVLDQQTGGLGTGLIALIEPIGTLVATLLIATALSWRVHVAHQEDITFILSGLSVIVITNIFYGQIALAGLYTTGHPVGLGWQFGVLLIGVATVISNPHRHPVATIRTGPPGRIIRGVVMAAGLVIVVGVTFATPADEYDGGSTLLLLLVSGLGILRLIYSILQESRLGRRTRERDRLVAVVDGAAAIAASVDYDDLLARLAEAAASAVGRTKAELYVFREDWSGIEVKADSGLTPSERQQLLLLTKTPIGGPPAERRMLASRAPELQRAGEPGMPAEEATAMRSVGKLQSLLTPLIAHDDVVGTLVLWTPGDTRPFDPEDIAAAAAIGQQAGLAIYHARLLTRVRHQERHLAARNRELEEAQRLAHLGSWEFSFATQALISSDEAYRIAGREPRATPLPVTEFVDIVHEEDRELLLRVLTNLSVQDTFDVEYRIHRPDGEERVIHSRGETVRDEDGLPLRARGTNHDITDRKRAEERLVHQAFHDPLTGLANRSLFLDRLTHALARARQGTGRAAILFVDLDNFKLVNDSLGHSHGDELLVAVAERLRGSLRTADTLARFGGDEFTMLMENVRDTGDAINTAERIMARLQAPVTVAGHDIVVTPSIGIALSSPENEGPDELLRQADVAMYRAKRTGKSRYHVFDTSLDIGSGDRLQVEIDLRQAVARNELLLHYQPVIDLATGRIRGMEALVRWNHPDRGLLLPCEFIPIAEETGLILPIGMWVLSEACRQTHEWHTTCPDRADLIMSVNLSMRQFQLPNLVAQVAATLHRTGLSGSCLMLEITETMMIHDPDAAVAAIQALKDLQVRVAIDDFGTGYSGLSYLKRLPVDLLKVDRSFVTGLESELTDTEILSAIIKLAHALDMRIVAEGVENRVQAEKLRALGGDYAQGYHFSPPLSAAEATTLLADRAGNTVIDIRRAPVHQTGSG